MSEEKVFQASPESKGKAKQLRLFAFLAWIIAIALQVFAIFKLIHDETMIWLIVVIVVILALAITGSTLWKKANRLDPASEKDKVKFFVQNQLGAIMGVLALDRKSTCLNSSHVRISYAVFCLKKKTKNRHSRAKSGSRATMATFAARLTSASPPGPGRRTLACTTPPACGDRVRGASSRARAPQ